MGGNNVNVTIMVPPGANPHTYEPLPEQLKGVENAQMYAAVGSNLEFELAWMDRIQRVNQNMLVVNCSEGIQFIPNTAENENNQYPHVWVSPKNAKIMVENIYKGLVQVDPSNQDYYQENRDRYLQELDDLDKNITEPLKDKKNRIIMVYHPAWGYLCRYYNLQQISVESGGKEPTPQALTSLVDQAKKDNIKVIYISSQFSTRNAEVIASEIGGKVLIADDLNESYLENMKKVTEAFSKI